MKKSLRLLPMVLMGILLVTLGCEGTETRKQVDDTVETVAGQKELEDYQQMKEDLEVIQKQQQERLEQLSDEQDGQ